MSNAQMVDGRDDRHTRRLSRTRARLVAAAGIVVATLAAAAPSWAGPAVGC